MIEQIDAINSLILIFINLFIKITEKNIVWTELWLHQLLRGQIKFVNLIIIIYLLIFLEVALNLGDCKLITLLYQSGFA